jgi:hypothetical protein
MVFRNARNAKMRDIPLTIITAITLLLMSSHAALACSYKKPFMEQVDGTDYIFIATIEECSVPDGDESAGTITFKVLKEFKGLNQETYETTLSCSRIKTPYNTKRLIYGNKPWVETPDNENRVWLGAPCSLSSFLLEEKRQKNFKPSQAELTAYKIKKFFGLRKEESKNFKELIELYIQFN